MKNILITLLAFITVTSVAQQEKSISTWYQSPMMYNAGSVATGAEDFGFFTNFSAMASLNENENECTQCEFQNP